MKQSLAVLLALVVIGTTHDLDAAPPKPKTPPKAVYIAIKSIDTAGMTITVEPRNSMSTDARTYKVTAGTVIKVNGDPATLADLKPDMQIHFTLAADDTTATELSASRPPAGSE